MKPVSPLSAREILDIYFIENRARLLELAAFLDRIDRAPGAAEARTDFRYRAMMRATELLDEGQAARAREMQLSFSDHSSAPIASAAEAGAAAGASRHEDH